MLLSRPLPVVTAAAAVLLLAGPASAAPTAALSLSPARPAAAATTCLTVTVTATDAVGAPASDSPTVRVSLAATGAATTSFCDPVTGAAVGTAAATASLDVVPALATATGTASVRVGVTSSAPGPVTVVAAVGAVRSATGTATFSDPPPPPCGRAPGLSVSPATVVAGAPATATVTGTPGTTVQLYGYVRPSTTNLLLRSAVLPASGRVELALRPTGSARLYAVQRYCTGTSPSRVVAVSSPVALGAVRLGPLHYRFSGTTGGAPAGTPVLLLSRTARGDVLLARTVTVAAGHWTLDRAFTGGGRVVLVARTATTPSRQSGASTPRPTVLS